MEAVDSSSEELVEAPSENHVAEAPVVSFIVPTYNNAEYLPLLIDSVNNQYYPSWQLIIIDDGSTDNTEEVVAPYLAANPDIIYRRTPNGGPGHARNIGIDYATGTWLMFIDADDILTRRGVKDLVALGERENCDIVTGDVKRLEEDGRRTTSRLHRMAFNAIEEGVTNVYESPTLLYDTSVGNKMIRRSLFEKTGIRWVEDHFYEDVATITPCYCEAKRVGVLKEVVYLWRVRGDGSQSTTQKYKSIQNFKDRMLTIRDVDRYFQEHVSDEEMRLSKDLKWLSHDMRIYLNSFPEASEEFKATVMEDVGAYAAHVDRRVFDRMHAIDRIKYTLVERRDAEGITQAVLYDREHYPGLHVTAKDGRLIGSFPFDDLTDDITDMTDELRERGMRSKVARVDLHKDALSVEALMQIDFLEQHEGSATVRLVRKDGAVTDPITCPCTALPRDSYDAKRFERDGSAFRFAFELDDFESLVARLDEGDYRFELAASFESISCQPSMLSNPFKGCNPRPFPLLIGDKVVTIEYDTSWRLTLKVRQAKRLVTAIRMEHDDCFMLEFGNGKTERFEIPSIDSGARRTFGIEDTQLVDSRPRYFVRRTTLDQGALKDGFMLAAPLAERAGVSEGDAEVGYELWRSYNDSKGQAFVQMVRPSAIVTEVSLDDPIVHISFAFPLPHKVKAATLLLTAKGKQDLRFPLDPQGSSDEGQAFSLRIDCADELLQGTPLGTYAAKVELELEEQTLKGWAWSGEPKNDAILYAHAVERGFSFDRRESSLYVRIWDNPKPPEVSPQKRDRSASKHRKRAAEVGHRAAEVGHRAKDTASGLFKGLKGIARRVSKR